MWILASEQNKQNNKDHVNKTLCDQQVYRLVEHKDIHHGRQMNCAGTLKWHGTDWAKLKHRGTLLLTVSISSWEEIMSMCQTCQRKVMALLEQSFA